MEKTEAETESKVPMAVAVDVTSMPVGMRLAAARRQSEATMAQDAEKKATARVKEICDIIVARVTKSAEMLEADPTCGTRSEKQKDERRQLLNKVEHAFEINSADKWAMLATLEMFNSGLAVSDMHCFALHPDNDCVIRPGRLRFSDWALLDRVRDIMQAEYHLNVCGVNDSKRWSSWDVTPVPEPEPAPTAHAALTVHAVFETMAARVEAARVAAETKARADAVERARLAALVKTVQREMDDARGGGCVVS